MEQNEYKSPDGYYYADKDEINFFEGICLGKNDSIDNYHLIEIETANEIIERLQKEELERLEAEQEEKENENI